MKIIFALIVLTLGSNALADEYVRGYTKASGTYVEPHMRSNPNGNPYDNWSTQGNTNPYTGAQGTRSYESIQNQQLRTFGNQNSGFHY